MPSYSQIDDLVFGTQAAFTGQAHFLGTTSGNVTVKAVDAAGTWTFKWPITAGINGQVLQTDGNGNATWALAEFRARVSTQFDKTTDTTLANVTGLSVTVAAGRTYQFQAVLFTTSNVAGGVQAAVAGTCTATAIIYEGETTAGAAVGAQTRATALGTAVGAITAVTAARIDICGMITVNAAGTLTIQFAQNASNGAASSVLVGSYMLVQDMP